MSEEASRRRLGRGLAALLGEATVEEEAPLPAGALQRVPIELLSPNPHNPRRRFAEGELEELALSIQENGILQPLLVRLKDGRKDHYEIIAGERRWCAAQKAGLHEVPVLVHEASDQDMLELAIVENVQRVDLNPIEEAEGYQKLMEEFAYTQEDIARMIGKSRSHVANTVRLLRLPQEVRALLQDGALSAGHAKILGAAPDPAALASQIVTRKLSVRAAEDLARQAHEQGSKTRARSVRFPQEDANIRDLERSLSEALGLIVALRHKADESGEVRIKYKTLDQLDFITQKLCGGF